MTSLMTCGLFYPKEMIMLHIKNLIPPLKLQQRFHFLDAFYVAAESDEYVLLAKADLRRGAFVDNENAQSFGWIHKRNLILSKNSLKDEHHIYQKALVINSIDQIEKVFERKKLNSLLYRKGPGQEYTEKDTSRVLIFICSENKPNSYTEPSMYLLARKSVVLCW